MTVGRSASMPEARIALVEKGEQAPRGWFALQKDRDFSFSTEPVRRSTLAEWEEVIQDAMVVSAAVEYADYATKRRAGSWERSLSIDVPVHESDRWNAPAVVGSLRGALGLLTGDSWRFSFRDKNRTDHEPLPSYMSLESETDACMPYSSGMDSMAVSQIEKRALGSRLLLVRVHEASIPTQSRDAPFVGVPYSIAYGRSRRETSGRTRGFRFALISGIAAYLAEAPRVLLPESGQGAIGPAIITVGHSYPDYRNHPLFARSMERFLKALLGVQIHYELPRLWHTKGETLSEFIQLKPGDDWHGTRSCWRDARWCSVNGKRRQCGICAACMLRRMSVHAAARQEPSSAYVAANMDAKSLDASVDSSFTKHRGRFRDYAIAGVRHMKHMADLVREEQRERVAGHAALLGPALDVEVQEAEQRILTLFEKHREEWKAYLGSLHETSFVRNWNAVA